MNKDEHILRVLSKIKHKKYEHFVIARIIQIIFNTDIKFVCQQLVRLPDRRALMDIYFPQVNMSLEIDEPQHENEAHKQSDEKRSRDIIKVTGLIEEHIAILDSDKKVKSLVRIAEETDEFLKFLCDKVDKARVCEDWMPWDFDNELTARPHLKRGYIDARDDVLLRRHIDVIKMFGRELKSHQSGGWRPPEKYGLAILWFPKLYKNGKWDNSLSDDGTQIIEKNIIDQGAHIKEQSLYGPNHLRAVFARREEPLIGTLYRFVGVFKYSIDASQKRRAAVYNKIADRIDLQRAPNTPL